MIVVIDTNVWISALLSAASQGTPVRAIERAVRLGTIATCAQMEVEMFRVLTEKFGVSAEKAIVAFDALVPFPQRVEVTGSLRVCRDPNDDMVLECAVAAGAQIILTGDKDLLALDPFQGVRILTPAEFLAFEA